MLEHGEFVPPDPNITRFSTGHYAQRTTINDTFIMVEDPWLGDFIVQDPLMYDFYTTPNAIRSFGVTQLCKSRESSTIPNLASFSRGWGLIAQNRLVEKFGQMQDLDEDHIRAIHIAVEGSDQAHTARSHELELAVQRWSGPENFHEMVWPEKAALGGTVRVLQKHDVKFNESIRVPGILIPEWAEAQSREDIDLDRLQYIAAEALLWFDHEYVDPEVRAKVKQSLELDNFEITEDGKLAFKDAEHALVVSKLIMLFSTEHWNDPLNRAHLHLDIHGVQRNILKRRLPWMNEIDKGVTRNPVEYYHAIDSDFDQALVTGPGKEDDFIYLISNTLNASGMEERRKFIDYRLKEYCRFIQDDLAVNYPSEHLQPKRVEFGPRSSTVHTEVIDLNDEQRLDLAQVKVPQLESDPDTLTYLAGPLKNRYIDPLVKDGMGGYERLSQRLPQYAKLLEEHKYLQTLGVKVTFAFTPDHAEEFRQGMQQNDVDFETIVDRPNMTEDQKRAVIETSARSALNQGINAGTIVLKREFDI